jgi:hypothetical protein
MVGVIPKRGSPPPRRNPNETIKAQIDPIRFALGSYSAHSSCGKRRTKTRLLAKNQSAWTLLTSNASIAASMPKARIDRRMSRRIDFTREPGLD